MANSDPDSVSYSNRRLQIRKEDMYMFTALWMQESPWTMTESRLRNKESTEYLNVVGSVFVLPNDRVLSADCTRLHPDDNYPVYVHGAIRPLIKYPDKVKGCQVYLTRKPCAHCVKMLVQAEVSKVFYLPLQPEKPNEIYENKSVDALFQVSEVSKSFYVPNISQQAIFVLEEQTEAPYKRNTARRYGGAFYKKIDEFKKKLQWDEVWYLTPKELSEKDPLEEDFSKEDPLEEDSSKKNSSKKDSSEEDPSELERVLDWQEYGDEKIAGQVRKDMDKAFEWFYLATFATGEKDEMAWKQIEKQCGEPSYDPKVTHLTRLAQMLSNRTDDPNRGVGCVIVDGEEIVSIGWNGFPSKALYGNHPRGSDKYPHVIHAEQNALLSRNQRILNNSVVYVNEIPCNECMPMLYELGVKKVVLPFFIYNHDEQFKEDVKETYFYKCLKGENIRVLRHAPDENLEPKKKKKKI